MNGRSPTFRSPGFPSGQSLLLLVVAVTVARLLYVFFLCPFSLAEDEAQYWEWSRHLDWSYYTKGPGVAWAIGASTWVQRALGLPLNEAWVRLPAVISGGVLAWAVGRCALEAGGSSRAGLFAAGLVLLCPFYQIGALLMTIDPPYLACWALACLGALRALLGGSRPGWWLLGVAFACGFIFKYTMLLFLPGLLVFVLVYRKRLALARGWGIHAAIAAMVGALGLVPVAVWNAQNDWGTIAHLLGHLGAPGGDLPKKPGGVRVNPMWTISFIGQQFMFAPAIIIAIWSVAGVVRGRMIVAMRGAGALLAWLGTPVAAFYLIVTLFTDGEGNWAASAYVSWFALGGILVEREMSRHGERVREWRAQPPPRKRAGFFRRSPESPVQVLWHATVGAGAFLAVGCVLLLPLSRLPGASEFMRAGRITSAPAVADEVRELAARVSPSGEWQGALIIAQHYGVAHQLAFYLPGHPTIYCTSSRMGGRKTQHDFWEQTDLRSPSLVGMNAVCLGATEEQWTHLFERVEPIGPLETSHKKDRLNFLCYGYKGLGGGE